MKPPKQNSYVALIGTILIMWLMVGYVYLLTPLETLPSPSVPPLPEAAKVTVKESLRNRAQ